METENLYPHLIYTDLGLDITGDHDDVYVIDPDTLVISDADREILESADQWGVFGPDAAAIVRREGVPLADLWAAYQWRQTIRAASILGDVEDHVARLISDGDQ